MRTDQCYIRDIVISKAYTLPKNLVFSPNEKTAGFIISFLANTSSEILKKISDVCKQYSESLGIHFKYKAGPKALDIAIPTDSKYEDFKNLHIEVNNHVESVFISTEKFSFITVTFLGQ